MGQGGAMAIEDAVSVAVLLPLGTSKQQIPERLRLYEKCRKQRNETVLMYTRMNGRDEGDDSVKRMTGKLQALRFDWCDILTAKQLKIWWTAWLCVWCTMSEILQWKHCLKLLQYDYNDKIIVWCTKCCHEGDGWVRLLFAAKTRFNPRSYTHHFVLLLSDPIF